MMPSIAGSQFVIEKLKMFFKIDSQEQVKKKLWQILFSYDPLWNELNFWSY